MKKYKDLSSCNNNATEGPQASNGHAHAKKNLEYALDAIKKANLTEAISVRYHEYDHWSDIITDPICVTFSWRKKGERFAFPISFLQDQSSFKQELDRFLSACPKKKDENCSQPSWYNYD